MENQESNVDIFSEDISDLSGEIENVSDRVMKVKEEELSSVAQWYISLKRGINNYEYFGKFLFHIVN